MNSYLVIKNALNESCVCSGIMQHYGTWRGDRGVYVGNYEIINHVAGNITSIGNLLDCQFSAIGGPAIIIMSVKYEGNQYDLFCTEGNEDICCRINGCLELGTKEKDIIRLFNKRFKFNKLDLDSSGFCSFLLMYFGFTTNSFVPIPLRCSALFYNVFENNLTIESVHIVDRNVIDNDIQRIESINVSKSSAHRISFGDSLSTRFDMNDIFSSVSVVSPIKWMKSDIGRSDDGIYKRFYGIQSTSKIQFSLMGLLCLYRRKFFEKCENLKIPIRSISKDEYEFLGDLNLPIIEEQVEDEDWYEPNFKLREW